MILPVKYLWTYRGFICASVGRDFSLRYRNSLLGAAWVVINPLVMILIYTLIFSKVMQNRLPGLDSPFSYSIFLMAGLLPWNLLSELVSRGPTLFLDQSNLIKKIQFPKLALLVVAIFNSLINFIVIEVIFIIFLIVSSQFPGWPIIAMIPLLILQLWLCAAVLLILALLNVFFRDVASIAAMALQFGFWLTPIVYAPSMIPQHFWFYLQLNPLTSLFEAYQTIFVGKEWPIWHTLWPCILLAAILTVLAGYLYQRRSAEMVDQL